MKRKISIFLLFVCCVACRAEVDLAVYYAPANNLNQGGLKTALYNVIKNPKVVGYDKLWKYFPQTDRRPDGTVWDMYSGNTYYFPEDGVSTASGMDKEHAFPKSWWTSGVNADKYGCYSDLFNLNPADAQANQSIKSNYALGEIDGEILVDNGVSKRGRSTYRGQYAANDARMVWEPADEYKGDFARTYMYVATCYEFISYASTSGGPTWTSDPYPVMMLTWNSNKPYPIFTPKAIEMLLDWHHNDPVSEKELKRNEVIYKIQGNRNPFIDCPAFADYIWGDKKTEKFNVSLITGKAFFTVPQNGDVFDFRGDSINKKQTLKIQFKAQNLTKSVNLQLIGKNKDKFTLPQKTISASKLQSGAVLTFSYISDVPARDTVVLQLNSSELEQPLEITLAAETFDTFKLLPTNTTEESFTINWQPSLDAEKYRIFVFQPKDTGEIRWQNVLSEDFVWQKIPATWTKSSTGFDIDQQNYVKLASGSNPGFVATPTFPAADSVLIRVRAATYNNKATTSTLTISVNDKEVGNHTVTSNWTWFSTLAVSKNFGNVSCKFAAPKGKQIWLDSLEISARCHVESQVPISAAFPTEVKGTKLLVDNLEKATIYWFTIQPIGGLNTTVYGPFSVKTVLESHLDLPKCDVIWSVQNGQLFLEGLPANTDVALFDISGHKIFAKRRNSSYGLQIPLQTNGIFVLRIGNFQPIKIAHVN